MNNFEQSTTLRQAIEVVDKLDLFAIEKFALTSVLNAYSWISSNDILIDATYDDIIALFVEDLERTRLHTKEETEKMNQLLSPSWKQENWDN